MISMYKSGRGIKYLAILCSLILTGSSVSRAAEPERYSNYVELNASAPGYNESMSAEKATPGKNVSITGDVSQLKKFFDGLKEAKGKKIRIAHFGDSIIEGDLISTDLRHNLQSKFGGNGAGLLSMNSYDIQFRKSTRHTFSSDWKSASLFTRNPEKMPLGLNGVAFVPTDNSWVKFETSRYDKWLKSFKTARVIAYNPNGDGQLSYSFNNSQAKQIKLEKANYIKETVLNSAGDANSLQINFKGCSNAFFYGVSLENGNGVYVDNIPLRGNSGVGIADIPMTSMKGFASVMDYRLIIINFGLNVLTPEASDYAWYVNKMEKVINMLKEAFPKASILVISVGDKSVKKGSRFVTDPGVPSLVKAQRNLAEKTHVAFWNLYEAMGGDNSMEQWVSAAPPMAFKDYSHFTYEGAEKVGELLTNALMEAYNKTN